MKQRLIVRRFGRVFIDLTLDRERIERIAAKLIQDLGDIKLEIVNVCEKGEKDIALACD